MHCQSIDEINENEYLWKFLDIHKFLNFLYEKKISFTRFDKFEDPNEGLSMSQIRRLYECELFHDIEYLNTSLFPTLEKRKEAFQSNYNEIVQLIKEAEADQKKLFASCWFKGNKESYAMWNLYSNEDSVAIRVNGIELANNIVREAQALDCSAVQTLIYGSVEYYPVYPPEYDMSKYYKPKVGYPFFLKDESYSYEKEYRFTLLYKNVIEEDMIF